MAEIESFYDYKKYFILYVDDEEKSLKYFRETYGSKFSILTASSAEEGFRLLQEHQDRIAVLMTDQRMPGEKGIQLLERARQAAPRIIRVLVTAYSDLETAVDSINTGAIYKYVTKPWDVPLLGATLQRALEFFIVQSERDHLLREKMSTLYNIMMTDRVLSLGLLAAGLGHHLRNSMVAIKTFLDLAPGKLKEENLDLGQLRNPDFWKDYYQKVRAQMDRVTTLLSDLWESTERPTADFPDKVDLKALLEEAHGRAKPELEGKRITVENSIPAGLPPLKGDRRKLERLFELFLKEEAATLAQGGKVVFRARQVGAPGGPSEIEVELEDNGPGLPRDAFRSVFDPFFVRSDKPQDTGIQLVSCFFIVYHHGGRITARGLKGKGNVFTLTLPLDPTPPTPALEEKDLIGKILLNEALWERLLSEG